MKHSHWTGCMRFLATTPVMLAGLLAFGCGETVTFNVLSPAKVNVKKLSGTEEPTVAVGEWKSSGSHESQAQEIAQYLRELVTTAEGGVVKFADANGVVRLDGMLSMHDYKEEVTDRQATCSRIENKKQVQYPCTIFTRSGMVHVRASMNVVGRSGTTLSAVTETCDQPAKTEETDKQPPTIDPEPLFLACRHTVAANFAKAVVPYRINVSKPWFKCGGGNDQCKGALAQLRAGNFDQAKGLLDQALPMAGTDAEAQAAVHWGLTLVAEFSADYAGAEEHVNKAIQLQPTENAFSTELASIRQREKDESELRSQGVK